MSKFIQLYADDAKTIPAFPITNSRCIYDDAGNEAIPALESKMASLEKFKLKLNSTGGVVLTYDDSVV